MWGNTVARKNHMGKYCSNSQCFFQEKNYKTKLLPAQYEKTKIDKDNSRKKQRKQKKNHMGKHCNNQQYFKEKTIKLNSQLAQY